MPATLAMSRSYKMLKDTSIGSDEKASEGLTPSEFFGMVGLQEARKKEEAADGPMSQN